MPRIELIDVPLFNPNDPYHWQFDNLPFQNLMTRQNLINVALDDLIDQTRDAIGTQGSLSNRLNQSIDADGNLKKSAVDETEHSMGSHSDDEFGTPTEYANWLSNRNEPFVRMTKQESDKLSNIAVNATNFYLQVDYEDDTIDFNSGILRFVPSSSVTWEIGSTNQIKAHLAYPVESAHKHFCDQTPVHEDSTPDYKNYKVNSISSAYIEGSLKVYINGIRLSATDEIYVPGSLPTDAWTKLSFTPDHANGIFVLSNNISDEDIIRIDYDIQYISA